MPLRLTQALAERHEALFLHFEALQKSVALIGAKHPAAPLPQATRAEAEALLFDAAPFLTRARADRLPVAAPDHAGLLTQLGQALAALAAYEARWTEWDPRKSCFCWIVKDHRLPVRRLHPKVAITEQAGKTPETERIRQKFLERLARQREGDYEDGYKAGLAAARDQQGEEAAAPGRAGPRVLPL